MGEKKGTPSKNEFNVLAAAAHDFKTPLSLINGLASELAHAQSLEEAIVSAQGISQAAGRLVGMIDTITLAHHVNQTQLELELEPVDLASVVNQAAYELHDIALEHEHPLDVRISRRLPTVMAHRRSVERIIVSLLDTAIRSATRKQPIQLIARRIGEEVTVSVTDATEGIKQREWTRLIASPGTAMQPSPALGSSSGVSLYAINQLATAMHGDFGSQTSKKGSVFLLRLPQVSQMRLF